MPPPNTTQGTAIDLGSLPALVVQQVDDGGITFDVWYKYTAVSGENYINVWGYGGTPDSGYQPIIQVWLAGAVQYIAALNSSVGSFPNRPIQIPVTPGVTYYFEFLTNGNFTPSNLTISAITGPDPLTAVPVGSLFVNDDTDGFGGAFISTTVDDDVLRFKFPFPAGEGIDRLLTSGRVLVADHVNNQVKLYNPQLSTIISTIAFGSGAAAGRVLIRANQTLNKFFAAQRRFTGNPEVISVDVDGVDAVVTTITTTGLSAFSVNNDETLIYLAGSGGVNNSNIKVWNIGTASFDADLVASVANHRVSDMLMLSDGTLLAMYVGTFSPNDIFVRRYNAAGTTLNTYTLGTAVTIPSISFGYRIAFALDNPASFWAWFHRVDGGNNPGISVFQNITIATGAVVTERLFTEYEIGIYTLAQTATPIREGISNSCGFIIVTEGVSPPGGGAFQVSFPSEEKKNDTIRNAEGATEEVAILNPFIITYLAGG